MGYQWSQVPTTQGQTLWQDELRAEGRVLGLQTSHKSVVRFTQREEDMCEEWSMSFRSLLIWTKPATVRCHCLWPVPTLGFIKHMHAGFLHKIVHMVQLLTHPPPLNLCCFQLTIPAEGDIWKAPSLFHHFGTSLGVSLDICRFFSRELLETWMVHLLEASLSSPGVAEHRALLRHLSTRMMS